MSKKKILILFVFLCGLGVVLWFGFFRSIALKKDLKGYNLVFITLDTTRADRIGCYGYKPAETRNLDRMAELGIWFENCYTPVPLTLPAHSTMFTGTYPQYHGVKGNGLYKLPEELKTLAEGFKEIGYQTSAFVSSFSVDSRFGIAQGFDVYDDTFREVKIKSFQTQRPANQVFDSFKKWFNKKKAGPFFTWVHFYDPHTPYAPPPDYFHLFPDSPYDGEIAFMDYNIGRVWRLIEAAGVEEKTLIICVGDHGEMLGEHMENDHGVFLYESALRIPFIIYGKNMTKSKRITTRVTLNDIYPTLAGLFGLPEPAYLQGRSLIPMINGKRSTGAEVVIETFYPYDMHGWSPLRGLVSGKYKLIVAPEMELYDIKIDKEEKDNLYLKKNRFAKQLLKKLEQREAEIRGGFSTKASKQLTAEEKKMLSTLGYFSTQQEKQRIAQTLPDPKDKIELNFLLQNGNKKMMEGKREEALQGFEKALAFSPRSPLPYVKLGQLFKKEGNMEKALQILFQGVEKVPDPYVLYERIAHFHFSNHRLEETIVYAKKALDLNPDMFSAWLLMAGAYDLKGEFQKALDILTQLLKIEPENMTLRKQYAKILKRMGGLQESLDYLKKTAAKFPHNAQLQEEIGCYYLELKDFSQAVHYLGKAYEGNKTLSVGYHLALAYSNLGRKNQAISLLEAVISRHMQWGKPEMIRRCFFMLSRLSEGQD